MEDLLSTRLLSELYKARDRYVDELEELEEDYHEFDKDDSYLNRIHKLEALISRYNSVIVFY